MIPARLLTTSLVIRDPGVVTDRYGNERDDWNPGAGSSRNTRGWMQREDGTETTADADRQISDWVLILAPDDDITGRSRIEADDHTFEVIGPPALLRTPFGPHHIEARLRHVEG